MSAVETQPVVSSSAKKSLSPLQLAVRRFRKNRLGVVGFWILAVLYTIALFAGFFSPYSIENQHFEAPFAVHVPDDGHQRSGDISETL